MVGPANRVVIKISKMGVNEVVIVTSQTRALEFSFRFLDKHRNSWNNLKEVNEPVREHHLFALL